jgi:RNA polymerase sigma-70 factor (ECF subfamily)
MDDDKRASFQREAVPHMDAVYRFALRLSGSPDQARDLVQDTFLRAFRNWEQYTPGTQCKSWRFTICRNLFLRQRERGQRHDEIVAENAPRDTAGDGGDNPLWASVEGSDPEGEFFGSIVDAEILKAIDALPEEYRTAVVLSDVEGLSYDEIAGMLDVPVGTVKSRLFRGRRRLQQVLYEYAVEMGYLQAKTRKEE